MEIGSVCFISWEGKIIWRFPYGEKISTPRGGDLGEPRTLEVLFDEEEE